MEERNKIMIDIKYLLSDRSIWHYVRSGHFDIVQLGPRSKLSPSLKVWTEDVHQSCFQHHHHHQTKVFDQFQTK